MEPEARLLLEHEAQKRAQITAYKDLAAKTGLSPNYISNFVSRRVRELCLKANVSRGTYGDQK